MRRALHSWLGAVLLLSLFSLSGSIAQMHYLVGIGKSDVTGPLDVNMMGYAVLNQTAAGIHTRQFARAYIFADPSAPSKRFVFVSVDAAMVSHMITKTVINQLQGRFGAELYGHQNVAISATHTHAGSGGYMDRLLYHITSLGFVRQSFDALVDGIGEAVAAAHADLRPAAVTWAEGELLGANINRSPTAYAANPESERAQYRHDVDKDMTVLMIRSAAAAAAPGGAPIGPPRGRGLISFFPVHPTSMSNNNRLLSGDNKGAAEQLVEKHWAAKREQDMEPGFAAAFVQSNGADTSPNVLGTFCQDTGLPCDQLTSTCNGNNQLCVGRGPAYPDDEFKSTLMIGKLQADKAQELWQGAAQSVTGPIDFRHTFVPIGRGMLVPATNFTKAGKTCPAAMGYSFAAGTTDGPGAKGFHQSDTHLGLTSVSPLTALVNAALHSAPSAEQTRCQGSKPILLNVGEASHPYEWVPDVTEVSLLRLGSFVIVGLPGEFSTMAGRRLRAAVYETVSAAWGRATKVVLATLTNTYSSYTTTAEEFDRQRYEGGSTLYGPHTLDAYIHTAVTLAESMVDGTQLLPVAPPTDVSAKLLGFVPPVVLDTVAAGAEFGDVLAEPRRSVFSPGEAVLVAFRSANPRNNLRRNGSFLTVERKHPLLGTWSVVATDDDFSTKFIWERPSAASTASTATIVWDIPADTQPGTYRIKHAGESKSLGGRLTSFEGVSSEIIVVAAGTAQADRKAGAARPLL